jgi:DNA-binding response OmpR family regulator
MTEERPRVLIVEDEPDMNSLEAEILSAYGFDPICAANAEEALAALEKTVPAAIVLDLMLPGLSGLELCRRLKTSRTTQAIPILICSALDAAVERRMGYEAGADDYLPKPFQPESLITHLECCIRPREACERLSLEMNLAASLEDVKAINALVRRLYCATDLTSPQVEVLRAGLLAVSDAAGRWAARHRGAAPVHLVVNVDCRHMILEFRAAAEGAEAFMLEHLEPEASVPASLTDAGAIDHMTRQDSQFIFEKTFTPPAAIA